MRTRRERPGTLSQSPTKSKSGDAGSLPGLAEALGRLEEIKDQQGPLRGAMVDELYTFIRVANILARHHDRVEMSLFPLLEQSLDRGRGQEMADELSASMQRAQPN